MAQRRRTRRPRQTSDEGEAPPQQTPQTPQTPQPGDLLRAARAWGDVARESLARSERGEEAERELFRRRNNSGQ